ncbi:MAG: hypothetical protein ABIG56_03965 [Candidatus Omnitrophota bacterium]
MYRLGPMLLGILFIWEYIVKRKNMLIILGFLSFFALYILSYFYPVVLGHRFLFFWVFYLHLAIAYKFREWELFSSSTIKGALSCKTDSNLLKLVFIGLFVCALTYNLNLARRDYFRHFVTLKDKKVIFHKPDWEDVVNKFSYFENEIGTYDVVISDLKTSWVLPTFSGKVVSFLKGNPLIKDRYERKRDNIRFFEKDTTKKEREELLEKYNVSFILLNPRYVEEDIFADIKKLGSTVAEKDGLVLIRR